MADRSGNSGPGGWGVLLRISDTKTERCGGEPATTNNRMELFAVIEALQSLTEPVEARVYTDSQYVQKGISEWIHNWKRRGWKTAAMKPVKNEDLRCRLDALAAGHTIDWRWVKGHAGHPDKERVDALARAGLEQAHLTGKPVDRTILNCSKYRKTVKNAYTTFGGVGFLFAILYKDAAHPD